MRTLYPKVSFIIPTLNAATILPKCLASIRKQRYPQKRIEIIIADGGSKDKTLLIAKKFGAKIIKNPDVLHEPGKTRAAAIATGDILFYTDADNILSHNLWLQRMTKPYCDDPTIMGFLPLTIPAPDSNSLDRYLGYLCADPFTWFVYGDAISGEGFKQLYTPLKRTHDYSVYQLPVTDPPMFGLSQGVGTNRKYKRGKQASVDDILAGIELIKNHGTVAYVYNTGVYHYHVAGFVNFIKKYNWRIKNNLSQKIKGMGLVNRQKYFTKKRKLRMVLFIPYSLSLVFPIVDSLRLFLKYKDSVLLLHTPVCIILSIIICYQTLTYKMKKNLTLGTYE